MSSRCIGEPVSWLQLELYLSHCLAPGLRNKIDAHLASCTSCHACLMKLREQEGEILPPLPFPIRAVRPARLFHFRWLGLSAAALVAVLVLAVIRPRSDTPSLPSRIGVKGGEVAITLVREHLGSVAFEPRVFSAGDRFKVSVSCPPSAQWSWDVVVYQGNEVSFPLAPSAPTPCSNDLILPGAFAITGNDPAVICAVFDTSLPDRQKMRHGIEELREYAVCETTSPAAKQ